MSGISNFGANIVEPPDQTGKRWATGGRKGALSQLIDMQNRLHKDAVSDTAKPLERASCARAWKELEAQRLILIGKPLPGSYRPDLKPKTPKTKTAVWHDPSPQPAIGAASTVTPSEQPTA